MRLDLPEARALLADRLRGRPTRANFRTGDMTICTLVPMRSVPHRVVCLLGLDDGLFPRPGEQDGDDLLLAGPEVGDRDLPGEDRQLLLDALLAATEHLVITYEGRDQHLNQRPSGLCARRRAPRGRRPDGRVPPAVVPAVTTLSSSTRCSLSTPAISGPAPSRPPGRGASTAPTWAGRLP